MSSLPTHWFLRFHAATRLGTAVVLGLLTALLARGRLPVTTTALLAWNVATLSYLTFAWYLIVNADPHRTRCHVIEQDQGSVVLFVMVLVAACAGLVAIGLLAGPPPHPDLAAKAARLVLTVCALVTAWLLIHTVFTFHYAREYYGQLARSDGEAPLAFPGHHSPDFLDFAYYSLVVGMTSQVSDVTIQSRGIRHITLAHGVLSFIFNIAVLALAINLIAGAL